MTVMVFVYMILIGIHFYDFICPLRFLLSFSFD